MRRAAPSLFALLTALLIGTDAEPRSSVVAVGNRFIAAPVMITATSLTPTLTVPANFLGLSFDKNAFVTSGYFTPSNTSLISLLSLLGTSGVLRIGGNSSDTIPSSSVTQAMVTSLQQFLAALGSGWSLIYGLNANNGDTAGATAEVGYCETAFGSGVVTYQVGNEPDVDATFGGSVATYLTTWESYYAAIHTAYPSAKFAGPDLENPYVAGVGWLPSFIGAVGSDVVEITQHYYTGNPGTSTVANLNSVAVPGLQIRSNQQVAIASPLPVRMSETNSAEPGGANGVSNVAVSAAWTVLEGIILAQSGWAGVNIHGGSNAAYYTPYLLSGSTWSPTPIFAGMVLEKALDGAGLLPMSMPGGGSIVWGLAFKTPAGAIEFLVANTDPVNSWPASVAAAGVSGTHQSVLMVEGVTGHASDSAVMLGGAQIGASGSWSGSPAVQARGTTITMPPASAALITLQ